MKEQKVQRTTFWGRLKAAARAFQGKPTQIINMGLQVKRCDECEALTSAEREARWKGAGMGDYYCSLCQYTMSGRTKFCPDCGAKMDEWEE